MFVQVERARCAGGVRRTCAVRAVARCPLQPSHLPSRTACAAPRERRRVSSRRPLRALSLSRRTCRPRASLHAQGRSAALMARLGFLPACGSATLLAFGLTADCPLIPGLNAFCIAFASAVLVNACLELKLRTKYKKSQGIELRPGENLAQILALSQPGLAIWGAVLTWPRARLLTEPDPRCGSEVFIGGFVASTIVISIIGCMLVGAILFSMAQWIHGCQRQTSGSTSSDTAVADPEATLVSGDRSDASNPNAI